MQREVEKMMDSLDKQYMRRLQTSFFKCGIKCSENDNLSAQQLQDCVERCQQPLAKANEYMHNELENFQNRLQRCGMDCQDRLRDALMSNNSSTKQKAHEDLEKCAVDCMEKQVNQLPQLTDRIRKFLTELTKATPSY